MGKECRAIWSEDGYIYDVVITEMLPEGKCIVRFIDYGNEEQQNVEDLMRPKKPPRKVIIHFPTRVLSCR